MYRTTKYQVCTQPEEAIEVIKILKADPGLADETIAWLSQSVYRAVEHLCVTDFTDSGFIEQLGLVVIMPIVCITQCTDGKIFIEYFVYCNDGSCVSRHEALDRVPYIPTPAEIEVAQQEIRNEKPHSHYGEEWLGYEGPGVQEFPLDAFHTQEEEGCSY